MDKSEEYAKAYDEADYEEGLTFAKIGYFFKKGWLIMIVCVLAAVLLTAAIVLPIKVYYKTEPIAKGSIEFIYDGIEEGKDPNGGTLNTDNIISTSVLSRAVEEEGLGSIVTDIAALREKMRVESVLTEEYVRLTQAAASGDQTAIDTLRNYTMYPTQFDIVISAPNKLGLTDSQAVALIERIIKVYYVDFAERFSVNNMFATDVYSLSNNDYFEFVDIYDEYVSTLTVISDYLVEIKNIAPKFTSTKYNTTFAGLSSELGRLLRSYENFNTNILVNGIWRHKATALATLNENKLKVQGELDNINAYVTALKAQIAAIQPNKIVTDANGNHSETVTYPAEYYEYQAQLNTYNLRVLEYSNRLTNIERRIENFDESKQATQAQIDNALAELKALETATSALVGKVNDTVTDYYDTVFVAQSVRTVRAPIMTRRSSDINVVIAFGVAVVFGLLVACIVTGVRIAKANTLRKNVASDENCGDGKKADKE